MFLPVLMILELELVLFFVFMLPELVIFDPTLELIRTHVVVDRLLLFCSG